MEEQMQAQQATAEQEQAKFQAEAQLKQMDNDAKLQVAQIGAESRLEVAKMQADVDRDIHDTAERNDMDKKAADYYIERKNKEAELDREDDKEGKERSRKSGSTTSSDDLKRAAQKI